MTKLDEFDSALQGLVNKDRMETYGHPADHFAKSAAVKAILRCNDPSMQHVIDMIADKLVRLTHSPRHLDSWIDVAGYARTAVMVIDREETPPLPDFNSIYSEAIRSKC